MVIIIFLVGDMGGIKILFVFYGSEVGQLCLLYQECFCLGKWLLFELMFEVFFNNCFVDFLVLVYVCIVVVGLV